MKTKKAPVGQSNLFFVELIMALLFFLISGAVIVRVFAAADNKAKTAAAAESAMLCAQSAAEYYSVTADAYGALCAVFGEGAVTKAQDGYCVKLDGNCAPSAQGGVTLTAKETAVRETAAGTLWQLELVFAAEKGEFCALSCAAYSAGGEPNE